jgi:copper chaperone
MPEVTIQVKGMSCAHCVRAVTQAIAGVPGVEAVAVSLERGEAKVQGAPDLVAIAAAVQEEGYQVELP